MISKLNEKDIAKKVAKKVAKRIENKFDFSNIIKLKV